MGLEDSGLLRPFRSQPKWTSAGFELWTSSLRRNNGTQEATGPHESRLALDQGKHHTPFYTVSWSPIILGLSFLIKYSSVPITRAGCNKRAGRIFHEIFWNEQVVLSKQGGIYLKFHKMSRLQLGMSRVLLKIILLLTLRFLSEALFYEKNYLNEQQEAKKYTNY